MSRASFHLFLFKDSDENILFSLIFSEEEADFKYTDMLKLSVIFIDHQYLAAGPNVPVFGNQSVVTLFWTFDLTWFWQGREGKLSLSLGDISVKYIKMHSAESL